MRVPEQIEAVLAKFDGRSDSFRVSDVYSAIAHAVHDVEIPDDLTPGRDAERIAFAFEGKRWAQFDPWGTRFHPLSIIRSGDTITGLYPDIRRVDLEAIEHWKERSRATKHPVLTARYADLVWDLTPKVATVQRDIEDAHRTIDSYIAAVAMDDGTALMDSVGGITRAVRLALSIKDNARFEAAVDAAANYPGHVVEEKRPAATGYIFDLLVFPEPPHKPPPIDEKLRDSLVNAIQKRFTEAVKRGDNSFRHFTDCERLVRYYNGEARQEDATETLRLMGEGIEKMSGRRIGLNRLFLLDDARKYYARAGDRASAERMIRQGKSAASEAHREMTERVVGIEIPSHMIEMFSGIVEQHGPLDGLNLWASWGDSLESYLDGVNVPGASLLQTVEQSKIGEHGVTATLSDEDGDPEGAAVWRLNQDLPWLVAPKIWQIDFLWENGLTDSIYVQHLRSSPLFKFLHPELVEASVESHLAEDYVKSIHVLLPQIERALVAMIELLGGASGKSHRTGRGVIQAKSMTDALKDEAVCKALGKGPTLYLTTVLSHPKGMNIRNEVCHGLMAPEGFSRAVSSILLHVLAALATVKIAAADTAD